MDTETAEAGGPGRLGPAVVLAVFILLAVSCGALLGPSRRASVRQSPPGRTNASLRALRYPSRVAVFGDSLSFEAEPYYAALIHAKIGAALTYDSFGGTAICDWLPTMRQVENRYHPQAVELEFSGNALTPCMKGLARPEQAYYQKYRADTEAAIDIFVPAGAHVYLIGAPISRAQSRSGANWDTLNMQYAQIAAADPHHVTYVDAGSSVEGSGQTFVETLPCLPIEPCLGPVVNGVRSNPVRAPDGAHFCPVTSGNKRGIIARCAVYSSGAFRYSSAMVEALATPASL
jgi:hypothetical protein